MWCLQNDLFQYVSCGDIILNDAEYIWVWLCWSPWYRSFLDIDKPCDWFVHRLVQVLSIMHVSELSLHRVTRFNCKPKPVQSPNKVTTLGVNSWIRPDIMCATTDCVPFASPRGELKRNQRAHFFMPPSPKVKLHVSLRVKAIDTSSWRRRSAEKRDFTKPPETLHRGWTADVWLNRLIVRARPNITILHFN